MEVSGINLNKKTYTDRELTIIQLNLMAADKSNYEASYKTKMANNIYYGILFLGPLFLFGGFAGIVLDILGVVIVEYYTVRERDEQIAERERMRQICKKFNVYVPPHDPTVSYLG